ncbi:Puromycin N-acetyltransferase [Paramyrothecium foliicola]|nr:Puromycin N-acetyltransferase [Paramyrothecium foliicola]
MAPKLSLRSAEAADVSEMVEVLFSAFKESRFSNRCFPPSDPECHEFYATWAIKNINDQASHMLLVVAEDEEDRSRPPRIAGWARWVRRPAPDPAAEEPPRLVFTADMYPRAGDGEFAARFFQANYDVSRRIVGHDAQWFLSMMVVRQDFQRRGVGALLMQYGVEKADEDGWMAYVNGSAEGKGLYERFGFRTVEVSEFEDGAKTWHMKRDPVVRTQ